jgi:hypothetical protein
MAPTCGIGCVLGQRRPTMTIKYDLQQIHNFYFPAPPQLSLLRAQPLYYIWCVPSSCALLLSESIINAATHCRMRALR